MANQTSALYLRLPSDLNQKLHELAISRGKRRFSMMVREALEEYVAKYEDEKVTS